MRVAGGISAEIDTREPQATFFLPSTTPSQKEAPGGFSGERGLALVSLRRHSRV